MNQTIKRGETGGRQSAQPHRLAALSLRTLLVIATITSVLVFADQAARCAAATGKTVVVTMTDKPPTYVPAKLTVKAGTTVLWKNNAKTLHDVTTDASAVQNKNDVALPAGAKPFDSGFMQPGASWSYTFTVPGHYVYACIPHEKDRMIGEITVTK